MNVSPPPSTFKEALRLLYSRYLLAAGIALGVGSVGIILYLMFLTPPNLAGTVVTIMGKALIGAGVGQTLVIIFMGLGGPVRKLTATFLKASISTEGDDDND